jgi:hypothetical protein
MSKIWNEFKRGIREGWHMFWSPTFALSVLRQAFDPEPEPLPVRLKEWLGPDGQSLFQDLIQRFGQDFGTAVWVPKGESIPYVVHFREGVDVRNWLRDQPECRDWSADRLDQMWAKLVQEALGVE